jgi:hypothetical protein
LDLGMFFNSNSVRSLLSHTHMLLC